MRTLKQATGRFSVLRNIKDERTHALVLVGEAWIEAWTGVIYQYELWNAEHEKAPTEATLRAVEIYRRYHVRCADHVRVVLSVIEVLEQGIMPDTSSMIMLPDIVSYSIARKKAKVKQ